VQIEFRVVKGTSIPSTHMDLKSLEILKKVYGITYNNKRSITFVVLVLFFSFYFDTTSKNYNNINTC
jgi:hypothetical protein